MCQHTSILGRLLKMLSASLHEFDVSEHVTKFIVWMHACRFSLLAGGGGDGGSPTHQPKIRSPAPDQTFIPPPLNNNFQVITQ